MSVAGALDSVLGAVLKGMHYIRKEKRRKGGGRKGRNDIAPNNHQSMTRNYTTNALKQLVFYA